MNLIVTCFATALVVVGHMAGDGFCQGSADYSSRLVAFVVNSSLPRTGLTKGFSRPTLCALIEFLRSDQSMISNLDITDVERSQLTLAISNLESLEEDAEKLENDIDSMLTELSKRTQRRLESLATSIDGLERICLRRKYNHIDLSTTTCDKIELLRKNFVLERAGPLISSEFGSSPTSEDSIRIAVAHIKCKIDFGIQVVAALREEERETIASFLELSDLENYLRNEFVSKRYAMKHGPLLDADLQSFGLKP